jgi:hypothetical protein
MLISDSGFACPNDGQVICHSIRYGRLNPVTIVEPELWRSPVFLSIKHSSNLPQKWHNASYRFDSRDITLAKATAFAS